MPLNFRPFPQDDRPSGNQYAQQWVQGLQNIGNTFAQGMQARREAERQAMLDQYLQQDQAMKQATFDRESRKFDYEYGTPISPDISVGVPTGNAARSTYMPAGMGQVATQSPLIDQFNKWRAGGMKTEGARAEFLPALGQDERKQFYENANPKPASIFMTPYQKESIGLKTEELEMKKREEENKKREAEAVARKSETDQAEKAQTISQKIDDALAMVGNTTAGLGGSLMGKVPGSSATDLQGVLDTIKANLGFDQLLTLKAGSKNGSSGLGALSENEMRLLTSLSQSLDRSQSPEQLAQNLADLKNKYAGFQSALGFNGNTGGSAGKIRVRNLQTGQTGSISERFFDPNKYERVP